MKGLSISKALSKLLSLAALGTLTAVSGLAATPAQAALLIGNTEGNNVVEVDESTGQFLGEFISPFEGFESPDTLTYGPDGNLYVSSGNTRESSAVYRFDGQTGNLIDKFASGGDLFRPYGIAFGPDGLLYTSSFRSDEILRYDGQTGDFVDVFAESDGTAAGLNGPNGLLFGPDGKLYVTTQGSVADDEGNLDFAFPSQVLRYDIATQQSEVFAAQPEPSPASFDFVSFLGLAVGPEDNDLYVSDFANGIRRYDFETGNLLGALDTNYTETSSNFIGSLAFDPADSDLYTVGFNTETTVGSLLEFDASTGDRTLVVEDSPALQRPIGLLFKADASGVDVPEPGMLLGLLTGAILFFPRKRAAE